MTRSRLYRSGVLEREDFPAAEAAWHLAVPMRETQLSIQGSRLNTIMKKVTSPGSARPRGLGLDARHPGHFGDVVRVVQAPRLALKSAPSNFGLMD